MVKLLLRILRWFIDRKLREKPKKKDKDTTKGNKGKFTKGIYKPEKGVSEK